METQSKAGGQTTTSQILAKSVKQQAGALSEPVNSRRKGKKSPNPKQKTHVELHKENFYFQQNMQAQNAKKAYYIPEGIPMEMPTKDSGVLKGICSIFCALLALVFFPFGIIGVILGLKSKNMGASVLGTIGVALSFVFMIVGMLVASWHFNTQEAAGGFAGLILRIF